MLLSRLHKTKVFFVRFLQHKKNTMTSHTIPCFFEDIYTVHFYGTNNSEKTLNSSQVDPETFRRYVFWRKQKYWEVRVEGVQWKREKMPKKPTKIVVHNMFFCLKMMVFTQNRSLLDMIQKKWFCEEHSLHLSFIFFAVWKLGRALQNKPIKRFLSCEEFPVSVEEPTSLQ